MPTQSCHLIHFQFLETYRTVGNVLVPTECMFLSSCSTPSLPFISLSATEESHKGPGWAFQKAEEHRHAEEHYKEVECQDCRQEIEPLHFDRLIISYYYTCFKSLVKIMMK